ncbi:MAG: hypothetical protein HXL76_06470 [[Eubacterium] sulci]|nr:hypothetical protein [[Eubacterium] sulci]
MALRTNYKNDVFEGNRKYTLTQGGDGKYEIIDSTNYTVQGDAFGANDINATNSAVNALQGLRKVLVDVSKWNNAAPYTQEISVSGITSADSPGVGLYLSGQESADAVKAMNKAFAMVDFVETLNGKIRVKCFNKKPAVSFWIGLKGV